MTARGKYVLDLLERAGATFVEVFLGAWVAVGADWLTMSGAKAAAVAGLAAGLSVVKSGVAGVVGTRGTAALLPKGAEPGS
jgi:hypothetical protein